VNAGKRCQQLCVLDVQWQEGFYVTAAASAQNSFAVVMSKGEPFPQQVSTACQKLTACRWKLLLLRKPCPLELHRWRHISLSQCRIDVRNVFRGEAIKRSLVGFRPLQVVEVDYAYPSEAIHQRWAAGATVNPPLLAFTCHAHRNRVRGFQVQLRLSIH